MKYRCNDGWFIIVGDSMIGDFFSINTGLPGWTTK